MKRVVLGLMLMGCSMLAAPQTRAGERHLELGGVLAPNVIFDGNYEFFNRDSRVLPMGGVDLRFDAATLGSIYHLVPIISYRGGRSDGWPRLSAGNMITTLRLNELSAGLRLRGWFLRWLGAFAQVGAGMSFIEMEGAITDNGSASVNDRYLDNKVKFNMFAGLGVESRISPRLLKKKGVTRFNFGGEVGVGLVKRFQTKFAPELSGADNESLPNLRTVNFGNVELSGLQIHLAIFLYFF